MGQYAVILTLSALFLGAVLLFNSRISTGEASAETTAYNGDRFAREVAQVGLERVELILTDSIETWATLEGDTFTGTHEDGSYSVTITDVHIQPPPPPGTTITIPDTAKVSAVSTLSVWDPQTGTNANTDYRIEAVYEKGYTDVGVPPSSRVTIFSDTHLQLRGTSYVAGDVHSNGVLESNGTVDVTGSGSCTSTADCSGARPGNFGTVNGEAAAIAFPEYAIPTGTPHHTITGAYTLDDTKDPTVSLVDGWHGVAGKGTKDDPYIFYVNGDVIISKDVKLPGYSQLYINGNVEIQGNASLIPVNAPLLNANTATPAEIKTWRDTYLANVEMGMFVSGNIDIKGTHFLAVNLYSKGSIFFPASGKGVLIGGAIVRNPLTVRGNARIYYNEPGRSTIPGGFTEVPEGVRLIAYREWACRPSSPAPGCP